VQLQNPRSQFLREQRTGRCFSVRFLELSLKPLLQWTDSSGNMVPAAEPQVSERGGSYDVILNITVTKTDRYQCVASQEEIKSKPAHIYVPLSGEEPERRS
ncbi:hypothetical protein KUCAC02_016851, partial [Chaenocephalus aceratus]